MGKKLTHEMFMVKVMEKNEHVRNGEIEILGKYDGANNPVNCMCNIHNINYYALPGNLYKGQGCKFCGIDIRAANRRMSEDEFVRLLSEQNPKVFLSNGYVDAHTSAEFRCDKGHFWNSIAYNVLHGRGCPYCAHKALLSEFNSVAVLRPDLIKYFENADDSYRVIPGSNKQQKLICPDCGTKKRMPMSLLSSYGFSCPVCSRTTSYPNRLIRAILNQFEKQLDDLQYEWSQKWTNQQRYDAYFEIDGGKYVVEMQGIQHYEVVWGTNISIEDIQKYDSDKIENARSHGIVPIVIDARVSDFDFIFNNVKNSILSQIIDMSMIDIEKCKIDATKNIIREVCEMYNNENLTLSELSQFFKVHKDTIRNYLKLGAKVGWTLYNSVDASKQNDINRGRAVDVYNLNNELIHQYYSVSLASKELTKLYNVKFAITSIFRYIKTGKPYKDFYFKVAEITTQN